MAFLDGFTKNIIIPVKKLTNTPKVAIIIFLIIVFCLTLVVILNADKRTKEEVTTTDLKVEETKEYDDKFVKNNADLFGYNNEDEEKKTNTKKPKNLKQEEFEKIFKEDPSFQLAQAKTDDSDLDEFLKDAGLSQEDSKRTDEILAALDDKTNIAKDIPALPVLILLDKHTNMYGVAGMDEKFPNGEPSKSMNIAYLTPEQQQAMAEAELAEAQAKYQELQNAIKSITKVVDNNEEYKHRKIEQVDTMPSYEDNLKTAMEYVNKMQEEKTEKPEDILNTDNGWTLTAQVQQAKKGEIKTGFVIPATLLTEIASGLKGMVIGQVRQSVYDTATGDILLIPQGTKVVGDYQSDVQYGAKRLFVNWKRLVFPNGSSLDLGSMPGADMSGTSGFRDKYDSHFWKMFGNALLFSFVIAGVNISQSPDLLNQFIPLVGRNATSSLSESVGQSLGETLSQMIQKNLNIAPDITIRSGYLFNIMITKDFILPEYSE